MEVTHFKTACFNQWKVDFSVVQESEFSFYQFSIFDQTAGSHYNPSSIYLSEDKAYLSAYFLCLRAFLDREKQPALLVHLETGTILSSNLAAFELLLIDATGANIADFMVTCKDSQLLNLDSWTTKASHQAAVLCNADGLLIPCEPEIQLIPSYSKWAILSLKSS